MAGDCIDQPQKPIRVLHVIGSLDVGGAEVVLQRLIQATQGNGLSHEVVSLTTMGPIGQSLASSGIPITCLNARSLTTLPWAIIRLSQIIRKQRPDVVQTWLYHADMIGGLAARLAGTRAVAWSVHSTHLHFGTSRLTLRLRLLLARLSSWLPARILYVAEASRRIHEANGYDSCRGLVIPNGFDAHHFKPIAEARERMRQSLGIANNIKVVGSMGRFNADKDHDTLLKAAALVLKLHPQTQFVLVGNGVSLDNPHIKALFAQLSLPGAAFHLLGLRQDIPDVLNAMDVFCLHSRSEAFPLALGEAMACGKVPVTTDVGDAGALVDGITQVVPPGDAHALALRLSEVLSLDDDRFKQLGTAARQRIVDEFSSDKMILQYKNTYKAMAGERA